MLDFDFKTREIECQKCANHCEVIANPTSSVKYRGEAKYHAVFTLNHPFLDPASDHFLSVEGVPHSLRAYFWVNRTDRFRAESKHLIGRVSISKSSWGREADALPYNGATEREGEAVHEDMVPLMDVRVVGLMAVGWAAFWAWFGYVTDTPQGVLRLDAASYAKTSFLIMAVLLAARIGGICVSSRADARLSINGLTWISAFLMTVGTAFVGASGVMADAALVLRIVGVVTVGVGAAWMSTKWVHLLRRLTNGEIVVAVSTGFFVAVVVKFVLTMIPQVGDPIVAFALPLLSAGLAARLEKGVECSCPKICGPQGVFSMKYACMLGLGIVCYGVAGTVVRSLSPVPSVIDSVSAIVAVNSHLLGILCCSFVICCIAVSNLYRRSEHMLPSLNRVILVVMALGVLLPGVFPGIPFFVSSFILGLALGCFEILLLSYSAIASRVDSLSPFRTLGIAFGAMEAGSVLGTVFSFFFGQDILSGSLQWSSVALVLLFLFTLAAMAVFFPFDKKARLLEEPTEREVAQDREESVPDTGAILRERFSLTERECQVALLLAEGRDAAYIQQALVISRGTVQTHSYHIYQKMGIHSKQELIELSRHLLSDQAI